MRSNKFGTCVLFLLLFCFFHALQYLNRVSTAIFLSFFLYLIILFGRNICFDDFIILWSIIIFHFKIGRISQINFSLPQADPLLHALPGILRNHLLSKIQKILLFLRNKRERLFFLVPLITLPLNLTILPHIFLQILSKILTLIIDPIVTINVYFNISYLSMLRM